MTTDPATHHPPPTDLTAATMLPCPPSSSAALAIAFSTLTLLITLTTAVRLQLPECDAATPTPPLVPGQCIVAAHYIPNPLRNDLLNPDDSQVEQPRHGRPIPHYFSLGPPEDPYHVPRVSAYMDCQVTVKLVDGARGYYASWGEIHHAAAKIIRHCLYGTSAGAGVLGRGGNLTMGALHVRVAAREQQGPAKVPSAVAR